MSLWARLLSATGSNSAERYHPDVTSVRAGAGLVQMRRRQTASRVPILKNHSLNLLLLRASLRHKLNPKSVFYQKQWLGPWKPIQKLMANVFPPKGATYCVNNRRLADKVSSPGVVYLGTRDQTGEIWDRSVSLERRTPSS